MLVLRSHLGGLLKELDGECLAGFGKIGQRIALDACGGGEKECVLGYAPHTDGDAWQRRVDMVEDDAFVDKAHLLAFARRKRKACSKILVPCFFEIEFCVVAAEPLFNRAFGNRMEKADPKAGSFRKWVGKDRGFLVEDGEKAFCPCLCGKAQNEAKKRGESVHGIKSPEGVGGLL